VQAQPTEADQTAIAAAKNVLRQAIRFRRDTRPISQRLADDAARQSLVEEALTSRLPDTVAGYVSTGSEPGTLQLIAWLAARRIRVLLPVLSITSDGSGQIVPAWAPYEGPDSLRLGPHSILEPTSDPVPSEQLPEAEVIICPGLAANRAGDRLGRGGGWYDRALRHASSSAPVWLLLNSDEVLETLPTHPWDRRVDVIVTPDEMIMCEPRPR
jgi:5-formyltetrahydrofolate cyclo-ligase